MIAGWLEVLFGTEELVRLKSVLLAALDVATCSQEEMRQKVEALAYAVQCCFCYRESHDSNETRPYWPGPSVLRNKLDSLIFSGSCEQTFKEWRVFAAGGDAGLLLEALEALS